jgi:hypothetical protein
MRSEILPTLLPTPDKWSYSAICRHDFREPPISSEQVRAYFEPFSETFDSSAFVKLAQAVARRGMWIVDVLPDAGLPVAKAKRRPITTREFLGELEERTDLRIFGHRTGATYGGSGDPMYMSMREVFVAEVLDLTVWTRKVVLRPRAVPRGPGERHDRVTPSTIARRLIAVQAHAGFLKQLDERMKNGGWDG